MKQAINWKVFSVLLLAGVVAGVLVLPYVLALSPALATIFTPAVLVAQVVQSLILFSLAIFIGLYLAGRVGLGLPILEGALKGERKIDHLKSVLGVSIGMGILAAILIILFSLFWPVLSLSVLKLEIAIPAWKTLFASLYGGIGEEILMRLFLMTLFVWILFKFHRTTDGKPSAMAVWFAIVISSIIFGLGHLPITGSLAAITPSIVLRAILLNGVGGVIFGWLYWKKGLESAMIAHFSADIVLHVILPFVASFLVK